MHCVIYVNSGFSTVEVQLQ